MFPNDWSQCNGIGGNNKTEWVVNLLRNTHEPNVDVFGGEKSILDADGKSTVTNHIRAVKGKI